MNLYSCVAGRGGERAKAMHSASVSSRSPPPPGGLEGGQRGRCRADRGVCCALSQWGSARHSCPFGERRAAPCQCSLSRRRPWGGCRCARKTTEARSTGGPAATTIATPASRDRARRRGGCRVAPIHRRQAACAAMRLAEREGGGSGGGGGGGGEARAVGGGGDGGGGGVDGSIERAAARECRAERRAAIGSEVRGPGW